MPEKNKILLKDYKPDFIPEAIDVTMEELNISRSEAIKILTEMSYRMHHSAKRKRKAAKKV